MTMPMYINAYAIPINMSVVAMNKKMAIGIVMAVANMPVMIPNRKLICSKLVVLYCI